MEFLECDEGKIIFEIGSQGDLFYLILDGVVEITIPDPNFTLAFHEINKKIQLVELQLKDIKKSLQENEGEKEELLVKLESVQQLMNKKGRSLFKIDDSLLKQEISGYEKRITNIKLEIQKQEEELFKASDMKAHELMIPFSHLGKGKTFGELALQINKEHPNK